MIYQDMFSFVARELDELETRDVDQLFGCMVDTLEEMRVEFLPEHLYREIERQVEAEKRADEYAGGVK